MKNRRLLSAEEIDNILGQHKRSLEEYIKPYFRMGTDPITKNIYLVYDGDDIYIELKNGRNRGLCCTENGYIYLRSDVDLVPSLLIHEFIHRLSRNRKFIKRHLKWEWVCGIDFPRKGIFYLNEAITEMIAIDITGTCEDGHPYRPGVEIVEKLCNTIGKNDLITAYFNGDISFFKRRLGRYYKSFTYTFFHMMYFWFKLNSLGPETSDISDIKEYCGAKSDLNLIISRLS